MSLPKGDCRLALYQDDLDPPQTQPIFRRGDIQAIGRELTALYFVNIAGVRRARGE